MQKRIVLADQDETYISYLEKKFTDVFGDSIDLYIITDISYMNHLFSTQQSFDVAVINENLFSPELSRHNFGSLFILCEEEDNAAKRQNGLYKYMSIGEVFDPILSISGLLTGAAQDKRAKIILLYSPSGGLGQTTLAAGICSALGKQFHRALFVGLDSLQTSSYLMQSPSFLPMSTQQSIQRKSQYVYQAVKPLIVSGIYDILPPFQNPLESVGVSSDAMLHMIKMIKESGEYDVIVLDMDIDFSTEITRLMAEVDQTVLITAQDAYSVHKLKCLMNSIDCSDNRRFTFVCTQYDSSKDNVLAEVEMIPVCEYVVLDENLHPKNTEYLAEHRDINRLAQKVI